MLARVRLARGSSRVYVAATMSGGGVHLRDGETLIAMREEPYATEAVLQKLLADHPDLLAGDQGDPNEPRRWLLVSQELSLATGEDGSLVWHDRDLSGVRKHEIEREAYHQADNCWTATPCVPGSSATS